MATTHERRRLDSIAKLLNNDLYSDLEIKCDEQTFYVHKVIVCPTAPFLAAAVKHEFAESKANEIIHEEFDANTVQLVLNYIYAYDYGTDDTTTKATISAEEKQHAISPNEAHVNRRLIAHARVYGLADYWGIPDLMTLASEKFEFDGKNGPINFEQFVDVIKEVQVRSRSSQNELNEALRAVRRTHCCDLAGHQVFLRALVDCDETQQFVVEKIQELNQSVRTERSTGVLMGVNFGNCYDCGDAVWPDVVVEDVGDEGAEQRFAIKCSDCLGHISATAV